ncbi:hypothetical protein HER27_004290 [Rhizobium phaseoli]|uniref:RiboL-PSP-HEPN domain-containing protein n=1 Tax=Rhizobium phaseoli TaxID=396 RepID=A0A7T0EDQ6_9HYPH|nr:hypothetical protein [Rhizobium phaseoli]QPK09798.1 hypothetical protein HER27_004290 [Rhizobium phaseoli]
MQDDMFYPPRNMVCTEAFSLFLDEYHRNLDYFFFVVRLVSFVDQGRVRAAKALVTAEADADERARLEKTANDPDAALRELTKHSTVQSRNLTNGIVNAFQRYFSSVIHSAALKKPIIMASSQTIRVDDIFRFTRHQDLVAFIIDRRINDLSYGGLSEMEKYFDDRLGVQMFDADRQRQLLRLFVEVRNINVHNGGLVNELFANRVGVVEGFPYKKGRSFHVDMDALVSLSENAMQVARRIDEMVSKKFGLKRRSHLVWQENRKAGGAKSKDLSKTDLGASHR